MTSRIVTHPAYEQTTVGTREASEAIDKAIDEQLKRECGDDEAKNEDDPDDQSRQSQELPKRKPKPREGKREAKGRKGQGERSEAASANWKSRSSVSANSRPCACVPSTAVVKST